MPQLGSPAGWSANRVPRDRASEASGGAALQDLTTPRACSRAPRGRTRPAALPRPRTRPTFSLCAGTAYLLAPAVGKLQHNGRSACPQLRPPLAQAVLPRRRPLWNEGAAVRARRSAAHAPAIGGGLAIGGASQGA